MNSRTPGFTLVEVLFALTLLAVVSTAVVGSLRQALHARSRSRDLLQATQLAADAIELARAGSSTSALPDSNGRFERRVTVMPAAADLSLQRIDVTVTWSDGRLQEVKLSTLLPR